MKRSTYWDLGEVISKDLFENISIGMMVMSDDGHYQTVNPAFCRMLGYSKKELTGKSFKDVTPPDDWKCSPKNPRQLQLGEPSTWSYEKRYIHKNGRVVWGRVNVFITPAGIGKKRIIFAQVVDITERKSAEEKLRESNDRFRIALAGSPTVVFTQDRELRYTWIYNVEPNFTIEDFLGKRDSDIFTPSEAKRFTRIKKKVLKTGVGHREQVIIHVPKGETVQDTITQPLRNESGKIIGVISAVIDITEHKRMEEALRRANEALEEKVKDRTIRLRNLTGELLHIEHKERRRIAHILHEDVQQQLAALKFLLNELKERSPTPPVVSSADRMLNELDHAIEVCRTLSVDLRPHVLNHMSMGKCIEWLATDVRNRLGLNVKVRFRGNSDLASDEVRVFAFEAVRELLLNAVKHSRVKSAEVLFRSMGTDRVKLQVKDKGIGFDPKQNHMANRHVGHFSIQERAELLGGHFEIASEPGKGTCATLILPCGKSAEKVRGGESCLSTQHK